MKQGSGSSSVGDTKREPISHAVDPGGVSQIGNAVARNPSPLYAGRGFTAPAPTACTTHQSGSQGKHK